MLAEGFADKIMHAELSIGDLRIFVSDGYDTESTFGGFSLALTVPTAQDAHRVFDALAQEGKVNMPLDTEACTAGVVVDLDVNLVALPVQCIRSY